MAWTIQVSINNGYPHNENTLYLQPGLTAPYPDGMWQISGGVNDGYPYRLSLLQPDQGVCLLYLGAAQPAALRYGASPVIAAYYGTAEIYREAGA